MLFAMKRIILLVSVLVLVISSASAWGVRQDEAAVMLAAKYLSPQAKTLVSDYLGDSYADDIAYIYNLEKKKQSTYSKGVHKLHLKADLTPADVEGDDALKVLEQALEVVRNHSSRSQDEVTTALRVVINLMCDIHNFANITIEGIPHSQSDFIVQNLDGKGEVSKRKWSNFFPGYSSFHAGYSAAYWVKDFEVCYNGKMAELSAGSLHDWVRANGAKAAELYEVIRPEVVMPLRQRLEYESLAYEMVARTGYRLAALLNETIK